MVGDAKYVDVSGRVDDPNKAIGAGNIAVLKAASTFKLPAGECAIPVNVGDVSPDPASDGAATRYSGFITGNGPLLIEAAATGPAARQPLDIAGTSANSYRGATVLVRGVLKLSKPDSATAIPGNLTLGGSAAENNGDGVIWGADGQLLPRRS